MIDIASMKHAEVSIPIASAIVVVIISAVLYHFLSGVDHLQALPLAGSEFGNEQKRRQAYMSGAKGIYKDAYNKFTQGLFLITTSDNPRTLVIAGRYIDELSKLPDSILSQSARSRKVLETRYTQIATAEPLMRNAIITDLTSGLTRLTGALSEEVTRSFQAEMPACDDWAEVQIYDVLARIVARVSGYILIGRELYTSEEYLDLAIHYTADAFGGIRAIKEWHPFLRPFVAPFLPEIRRCKAGVESMRRWLSPVIKTRQEAAAAGRPGYVKPDDMLQWMLDKMGKLGSRGELEMARIQISLAMAAIHTTSMTATHLFYDIAAHPEVVEELRGEIRATLLETNGVFTHSALQRLKKLDSVLRESFRLNPPFLENMQRTVLKGFTLSNGQFIPPHTNVVLPAHAINMDPNIYPEPEKFDAFRFERMRNMNSENAKRYQFNSVNPTSVNFGFGRGACPGRFFADNEIKLIVAHTLLNYDVKLPPGENARYDNIEMGLAVLPDHTKTVMLKRVSRL